MLVDPVMGDHGKLYTTYTPEMCAKMKQLVQYADLMTPNLTELVTLVDRPYPTTLPTFDDFQKNYQDMKNEVEKRNAEFSATKAEIDTRRQEIENEIAKQKASTSSVQQKSKEIEKEIKETQETIRYARDEMSSVLDELEDSVQEPGLNE